MLIKLLESSGDNSEGYYLNIHKLVYLFIY